MSTLENITDANFDSDVLQAELPVLVDYWATWCRPCQMLTPLLEEMATDYAGKIKIFKMNVDENAATPAKYGVRGIPTMIIYKNGKVAATKSGFQNKTQIASFINSQIEE